MIDFGRRRRWPRLLMTLVLLGLLSFAAAWPGQRLLAAAGWPPSQGLLVSEVVTGGASASDELVEIYNSSLGGIDVSGLEVVYVTASGTTTSRKASWDTSLVVPPHAHLLLANASGIWADWADVLYSAGLAASGGTLVLREMAGGAVIDSLSWGDATSEFVEGSPGAAAPAGSSLERLPGADLGNAMDANDNALDTLIQAAPIPQSLSAPPVPPLNGTPSPSPVAATPTPAGSAIASASLSPGPTSTVTPTPSVAPISIAAARLQPIGASVRVRGVVTASPGAILGDSTIAIQDAGGGICVKLGAGALLPVGSLVEVSGPLAAPYGNLEVRPAASGVTVLGQADTPLPLDIPLDDIDEEHEGLLVRVRGEVETVEASSTGTLTLILATGTAQGRIFFHAPLGLARSDFAAGEQIEVVGVVGDRLALYRVWPRSRDDVVVTAPPPTPTPRLTPTPRPTATPAASQGPGGSGNPTTLPLLDIDDAVGRIGDNVRVEGTVTTAQGLLDASGERVAFEDASGAVLLRLPAGTSTSVGERLQATGTIGTYYGAPQLTATATTVIGRATPQARGVRIAPLPAELEWQLVTLDGVIDSISRDGDAWRAELRVGEAGSGVPIAGLERSGISATAVAEGHAATITGIVKRAYPTATDQRFALVPRSASDITLGGVAEPEGSIGGGQPSPLMPGSSAGADLASGGNSPLPAVEDQPDVIAIAELAAHIGELVQIGGVVVATNGPVFELDDSTGVAAVRISDALSAYVLSPAAGELLNIIGLVSEAASGDPEVLVSETAGILRMAQPGVPASPVVLGSAALLGEPEAAAVSRQAFDDNQSLAFSLAALAGCSAIGFGSLLTVQLWRRHAIGDRLKARIAASRG